MGGVTQIIATLKLLDAVFSSHKKYDYICLISGQCYPLVSNDEISAFLDKHKETAFIDIVKRDTSDFDKRNDVFYPQWMIDRAIIPKLLRNAWIMLTGGKHNTLKLFRRKRPVEKFYYGSSWWCLPYGCLKEILNIIRQAPETVSFFEHSICCDECFFQTLIMQTSYKDKIKPNLVYLDWSEGKNSPKTFGKEDFPKIMTSKKLFARKLDMDVDSELFDLIDCNINKN